MRINPDNVIFSSDDHLLNSSTTFIRSLRRTHSLEDFYTDCKLHGHEFIELAIVVGGSAVHQMTTKDERIYSKVIGTGDVLFINPGDFHTFIFGKNESVEVENVIIDPIAFSGPYLSLFKEEEPENFFFKQRESSISARVSQPLKLSESEMNRVLSLVRKMRSPEIMDSPKAIRVIETLFITLLYELDDIFSGDSGKMADGKGGSMHKALLFIQNNYTERITVDDVAKIACCSRRQTERLYKYHTGETIRASINRLRISRACFLLTNTNMKMTAISLDVGIDNVSYFNKLFKQHMGISPSEFRRSQNKKS